LKAEVLGTYPEQGQSLFGIAPASSRLNSSRLWRDGRNVVFTSTGVRKAKGSTLLLSAGAGATTSEPKSGTSSAIRGLVESYINGKRVIAYGDTSSWYRYVEDEASAFRIGTNLPGLANETSGTAASIWSIVNWGNWYVASNGVARPQLYTGSSNVEATAGGVLNTSAAWSTAGVDARAEILYRYTPHLLAFNTARGQNHFCWCHTDDIEQWSANAGNTAGDITVRDMDSPIRAAVALGDRIAVYTDNSMYLVTYLGSPFYFGIQPALSGVGAVSKNSIVSVGRKNYGLSKDGFFVTDGVTYKYIDEPDIRSWFLRRINEANYSKVAGWHDRENHQAIWYYSTGANNENNEGVGFDYINAAWAIYDYGRSSALEKRVFRHALTGGTAGRIFRHATSQDSVGAALVSYIETNPLPLGNARHYKDVFRLYVAADEVSVDFEVQLAGLPNLNSSPSYGTRNIVSAGNAFLPLDVKEAGRFFSVRFESSAAASDFLLSGFTLEGFQREAER